ncbi:cell wall elongation regulator TseB-like domain-containing protein [Paenibacillus arenilitoris]|uniref:DUF5590 domain-containing protein n=1 Tax=Paenibacillus arenilitoris TaxID=2772299 RepID=A0A927CLP0_9BACL|nr:DUF5590 domain-containing protein [Paenibacillus arenilitoris]MBD2869700.1 DUF5590 domain-containing protein [Paenibacillus arenilitoris]
MLRSVTKKRPPFMTAQRWVFVIVASLLLLGTAIGIYFRDIQMPRWSAERDAEARAVEAADLAEVEQVYHHIWNKESWVVKGVDANSDEVFVWLAEENEPMTLKASEGISASELRSAFALGKPQADIKRMQPGLLNDTPVWEIFYRIAGSPDRYYYDFYRFDDGTFIDEYKLPAETEP